MEQLLRDFINLFAPELDNKRTEKEWRETYVIIAIGAVFISFGLYMVSQS